MQIKFSTVFVVSFAIRIVISRYSKFLRVNENTGNNYSNN